MPQNNYITDYSIFRDIGLNNVDRVKFAEKNLIIGKNGSGKTRFLKALEQDKKNKGDSVITLYFPEIQAFYSTHLSEPIEEVPEEQISEIYPYDLLLNNEEHSFYDFLKVMENDRGNFLKNFLMVLPMKGTRQSAKAKNILDELNSLLSTFLEKSVQIKQAENEIYIVNTNNNNVTRQLPLAKALSEFSPGELLLFYLCVFLMTFKQKPDNSVVLIIDEPEVHLHPRALIKMIRTLMDFKAVSELWIASHSIFLVPLFSFEEIVLIHQNNVFSRNSQTYKELYNLLVGLENIDVFEFLKSLDNWQYYQFIVECFCLPKPVDKLDVNDEQFRKLIKAIKDNTGAAPIHMLDYGAGKYRIWKCMQLLPDIDPGRNNVVYTAYEPYPDPSEDTPFKLYTHIEDIYADKQQFHVVVLMNVLHEIEATQWEQTFQDIYNVLTDDGVLIFLEVVNLSKGEQPYGNDGYLVLQDKQVKILFGDEHIANMRTDAKEKSNCWMVTRQQVKNVSKQTITNSIESLCICSYDALKEDFQNRVNCARQSNDTQYKQKAARTYAFLSQQYVNAKITMGQLTQNAPASFKNIVSSPSGNTSNGQTKKLKVQAIKKLPND